MRLPLWELVWRKCFFCEEKVKALGKNQFLYMSLMDIGWLGNDCSQWEFAIIFHAGRILEDSLYLMIVLHVRWRSTSTFNKIFSHSHGMFQHWGVKYIHESWISLYIWRYTPFCSKIFPALYRDPNGSEKYIENTQGNMLILLLSVQGLWSS